MPKQKPDPRKVPTVSKSRQTGSPWYKRFRTLIIVAVVVIIVAVTGGSIYNYQIRPYNQAAIKVSSITRDMRYYINTLELYFGSAPVDTTVSGFADWVEQQIQKNENIIQGSLALGVQIPRSEIEKKLRNLNQKVTPESVDAAMAEALVTQQVPATQTQYDVQAMLLETPAQAQLAINRLQAGASFDNVTSELSKYPAGSTNTAALGLVTAREADLTLSSTRFGDIISKSGIGVLSGPAFDDSVIKNVGYWVAKIIDRVYSADNVTPLGSYIHGILVGSEQEAKDIMDKLRAGADMDELAKQVSLVPSANETGADLGWISETQDLVLFNLFDHPMNTIEGPIVDNQAQTKGGYWVYNIIEKKDNQELTSYQKNMLDSDLTDKCTAALMKDPNYEVKSFLTQEMKDFALNKAVAAQGEGSVLIGSTVLSVAEAGVKYSHKLTTYGYNKGNTWSITSGSLPQGLTLDGSSGVISGTPRFAGGGGFTIKVENQFHYDTVEMSYSIWTPITVATESLPDGQIGTDYYEVLLAQSDASTYTWSVISGSLPDGLSLGSTTAVIGGKPTKAGTFSFTVQVDDGLGKDSRPLTITVK